MRIVHTADWHIGKMLNDYSLLEDQRYWFSRFTERLSELNPDALIIAGDLYDRSVPSAEAVSLCDEILHTIVMDLGIETMVVAGNHDSGERLSFGSGLLEKSGLHIVGEITREIRKVTLSPDGRPVHFYLLPYFEPYQVKMIYPGVPIKTARQAAGILCGEMCKNLDRSAVNILAAHGYYSCIQNPKDGWEALVGGSELIDASLFRDFDYVALGHIHLRCSAGNDRMHYSGSPLKYAVNDWNYSTGFLVAEIPEKGKLSLSFEKIPPLRDVRVLEGEFSEFLDREQQAGREDYVFLNLTDSAAVLNAISRLKAVYPHILGLRYLNIARISPEKLVKSKSAIARMSDTELFGDFYQSVTEEPLSPEQAEYIAGVFDQVKGGKQDDTRPADA